MEKKIVLTKSIEAKNPSARTRSRFLSVPPPHTKSIYKTTEEKNITKSHHAAARDAALLGRFPPRLEQRRLGLDQRAERGLDAMCADAWRWQAANPEGYGDACKEKKKTESARGGAKRE